jgi:hypothetical protein
MELLGHNSSNLQASRYKTYKAQMDREMQVRIPLLLVIKRQVVSAR